MAKILIVDDSRTSRKFLRHVLEADHHEIVDEAENGVEAIQKYKELRPDIVTMDITMPEMNGLEALIAIRKADPGAKVIMVSALGQESMVRDAVMAGAKGFVVKPFKEETITAALAQL